MELGIFGSSRNIDDLKKQVQVANNLGYSTFWTPQIFNLDALTALAVIAESVEGIRLGTSVIPTYPRHPMMLAQQALTVNQVSNGRLDLGIGLSHKPVVEGMWGISFDAPVGHMSDYLQILMALLHDGTISYGGKHLTSRGGIDVPADAPPVLVAALGPQMLKLVGRVADGTVTWMTGPETIRNHISPVINAAAEEAERPVPQVIAAVPVCITSDPDMAEEYAKRDFGFYGDLPSYRAMLEREGLANSWDIALSGSFEEVAEGLQKYSDSGGTQVVAAVYGPDEAREQTVSELAKLMS
ncbi:MAG: TIGR03564 family F420-dependent LLM class oxidoreductase [Actinomycetota bacterium]|nr:LLM class F420-dependent oxidoreductase [Acidimicrobiaceae bacterium]MEC7116682.1 TIGR03564 family F420-dependent LLM class oxidoreductase [Actinomycetota bacterium]MEC8119437.1 TIGR03564 family F420-dependent LLM class oxidoreductase [Actinomycetota bacterium]MEC8392719.1 TIGR03564 family F420-dependent LLM class oxidoreductase [Actinomycetota bacterium]MEE3073851.1 TIGR03564 family F420-dependent LLM class oxidoreductase [Actinomycetota bacterium]